jgi:hypothetical protein
MEDIDKLILSGAIEAAGVDSDTGEILYSFTPKLQKISPMLHDAAMNYFAMHAIKLWEMGFINMDVTEKNPLVSLTKMAFDKNKIDLLEEEMRLTLKEIKRNLLE